MTFAARWLPLMAVLSCSAVGAGEPGADSGAQPKPVTYTRDIAPILWKNCASCHRPGEVAPFSLLTYEDAAKRAEQLAEIVESRVMPPWKPEPGHGEFLDDRRLSDADIATIGAWADAGAPEGAAADLPPAPNFTDGWQLGEPDLVLTMPEAVEIPAGGRDIYQGIVIPMGETETRYVTAVEFRPGNPKVVHHSIFFLDNSGVARQKDEAEPGPGYHSFGGPGFTPTGGLGGWAPGVTPRMLPDGVARLLRPNSDLVLMMHYHPSGKPETDQSRLGIHFAKEPTKKILIAPPIGSWKIDIPPGETEHTITASSTLPADVQLYGLTPHMHLVGRNMKVTATLPDGKTLPLIWIKDWDFNWQDQYLYKQPLDLPQGTRLDLVATYDNSTGNLQNPNHPPQRVLAGEQTTDEMCLCFLNMVPTERAGYVALLTAAVTGQFGPGRRENRGQRSGLEMLQLLKRLESAMGGDEQEP